MNAVSHTPGPWRVALASAYVGDDINIDAGEAGTAAFIAVVGKRGDMQAEADARLVASAPLLLAELKAAERWLSGMYSETDEGVETELRDVHSAAWNAIDKMRAAIAKATQA